MTSNNDLLALADLVAGSVLADNSLDVQVEIALFEPEHDYTAVRANAAGSKVIYTRADGSESTFWAHDWTARWNRESTVAALRARALAQTEGR